MPAFRVRHVVASSTGVRVVLGAFERDVVVHDLRSGRSSATISTTFDFGGSRLACSDALNVLVAASYDAHGVAAYSLATQRELWRRPDLRQVQNVTIARDGRGVHCGRDDGPLVLLDLFEGHTIRSVRNARDIRPGSSDPIAFVEAPKPHAHRVVDARGRTRCQVERTTFAVLDVAFAPGRLALSFSGGPVRCVETRTGRELFRYEPPAGSHVRHLGYEPTIDAFCAVEWPYVHGGEMRLLHLSAESGAATTVAHLGAGGEAAFVLAGRALVLSDGRVLDSRTGETTTRVP